MMRVGKRIGGAIFGGLLALSLVATAMPVTSVEAATPETEKNEYGSITFKDGSNEIALVKADASYTSVDLSGTTFTIEGLNSKHLSVKGNYTFVFKGENKITDTSDCLVLDASCTIDLADGSSTLTVATISFEGNTLIFADSVVCTDTNGKTVDGGTLSSSNNSDYTAPFKFTSTKPAASDTSTTSSGASAGISAEMAMAIAQAAMGQNVEQAAPTVSTGEASYTLDATAGTAVYTAAQDSDAEYLEVPDTITENGVEYKVTSIASGAFANNKNLETVNIGKNVTTIGSRAFANDTNLEKVVLGKNVKSIGASAFAGDKKLTSITIKGSITKVSSNAFKSVPKNVKIKITSGVTSKVKKLLTNAGISSNATFK